MLIFCRRIRVNKKPPAGNNLYGRKGTLGCEYCRKRKQRVYLFLCTLLMFVQCIIYAEWLPCECCRSRGMRDPCIKLRPANSAKLRFNATKLIFKALVLPWLLKIHTPFPFKINPPKLLPLFPEGGGFPEEWVSRSLLLKYPSLIEKWLEWLELRETATIWASPVQLCLLSYYPPMV